MSFAHLSPSWFFGYDVALEFAFAIISLVLALFAFRIYKASAQKQVKLFGIAFLFISISYFIQSIFNFLIISKANENICKVIKVNSIALFDAFGINTHILFMTIGLVVLIYMTFKTDKKRVFWLLLIISFLVIIPSKNPIYSFFLLSSIYLIFIAWHFTENYLKNRKTNTFVNCNSIFIHAFWAYPFYILIKSPIVLCYWSFSRVICLFIDTFKFLFS